METTDSAEQVEVRRNVALNGFIGAASAALAVGYLSRASVTGGAVDWALCVAMTLIAITQFVSLMDARVPLVVADDEGVRLRLGSEWVGLPWLAIGQVVVEQRDLPWREGRLVVVPRNPAHVLDTLSPSATREVRWQRRLHGAPLSVPLSLFTRTNTHQMAHDLRNLAGQRAQVVALRGRERAQLDEEERATTAEPLAQGAPQMAPEVAPEIVVQDALETVAEVSAEATPELAPEPEPKPRPQLDPVAAVRAARQVMRIDMVRDQRPRILPQPQPLPEPTPEPAVVQNAVIDDFVPERVNDPVIGPQVADARRRAGLSVDELSERTRIRPHVLEAIEVDDFAPCGGDFYAKGHLSTLARYLGLDAGELHGEYDRVYASGPINARRVFEAELATGLGGGLRATSGGPRWSLLIGSALALTMIWGIARYFTDEPVEISNPTVSDSANLTANRKPITSPLTQTAKVSVKATGQPMWVSITDRNDQQLYAGRLLADERIVVVGVGPFQVTSNKASLAQVWLDGKPLGSVGQGVVRASRSVG